MSGHFSLCCCCFACCVAPLVFCAPRVVSGLAARCARRPLRMICLVRSGRSVCRWAAARPLAVRAAGPASVGRAAVCAGGRRPAREIATREPDGSEWSISRPALALPPPTGTATRPLLGPRPSHPALTSHIPEPHPISHVIPPRPFRILKYDHWNCNVFRLC